MSIAKYLESKHYAWEPSTIKTVKSKLGAVAHLTNKTPEDAYEELKSKYAEYTVKQYMIIINGYNMWRNGDDSFGKFLKQNNRLFKSAYKKKKVKLTYFEAVEAIRTIEDYDVQRTCDFLLKSGLRISEIYKCGSEVVGKGNKRRKVYVKAPKRLASPSKVRRALAVVGLTPHDLRKICATRLADKGVRIQDLCEIMGWSSMETASKYLQTKKDAEIRELMEA